MTHTQLAESSINITNAALKAVGTGEGRNWDDLEGWEQAYFIDMAARVNARVGYTLDEIYESIAAELEGSGFVYGENFVHKVIKKEETKIHPMVGGKENICPEDWKYLEVVFAVQTELSQV